MIKAQDLRLNNYILHDGKPYKVVGLNDAEVSFFNEKDKCRWTVTSNKVEPIELTPELLGKIKGIEKSIHGDGYDYVTDDWTLSIDIKSGRISVVTSRECEYFASDAAKYLHHLQNLVYGLSGGTELSITL